MPAAARPPGPPPGRYPGTGSAYCLQSNLGLLPGTLSSHAEAVEEVVLEVSFTTQMERRKVKFSMPLLEPTASGV